MKRHPIQISIPQPCSENWNKMTPQEQGRFCDSCQKCVVDFTNFSDAELHQYLLENVGKKACGRFRTGQLNRPIQIPYQPHSQLYKWIIAAGLSLVFTFASEANAFAQAPIKQKAGIINSHTSTTVQEKNQDTISPDTSNNQDENTNQSTESITIKGHVTDHNNDPVTNAIITIRKGEKSIADTLSDWNGKFELKLSATDTADANIFVHYIGLREYMAALPAKGGSMNIKLEPTDAVGLFDIIIIEHDPPLINKFEGGHTKTLNSDEIERGAY